MYSDHRKKPDHPEKTHMDSTHNQIQNQDILAVNDSKPLNSSDKLY